MIELNKVYNSDCLEGMKSYPDNFFSLAIIDPPYGIKAADNTGRGNLQHGNSMAKSKFYEKKEWDNSAPDDEYFKELFRISKNQIIFGANHFISKIPYNSSAWIVWDKDNGDNDYADCELAWTSFNCAVRKFKWKWHGMLQQKMGEHKEKRIHPTQKSIYLYRWILQNYATKGDIILDTHVGSQSLRIACHIEGFDYVGFELDLEYFKSGEKRFNEYISQLKIAF